jgi:ABC-type multidrug transport system permease subunit
MRGLQRIAESGRAVCATIHQPSVAVFNGFDRLLLLKRGGEVVFFGDLGDDSCKLIEYLQRYDSTPTIKPGENPATWMLTTIGAGNVTTETKPFDYAGSYTASKLRSECIDMIDIITSKATEENKVSFVSKFATTSKVQFLTVLRRALKVYFRSPSYNTTRITVAAIVALIFATVYLSQRVPTNENEMISRINSLFIAVLFLCVNSHNTVLSVFERERNMYYHHKAANMYASWTVLVAFTLAEIPFILLSVSVFSVIFYFMLGFAMEAGKFFLFWLFTLLGLATFTFLGQMLVALFRDSATAQGFGGLLVTFTSLFSGILIRPDQIPPFWIFM